MKNFLRNHRWLRAIIIVTACTFAYSVTASPWGIVLAPIIGLTVDGMLFAVTGRSVLMPSMKADSQGNAYIPGQTTEDAAQVSQGLGVDIGESTSRPDEVRESLDVLEEMESRFNRMSFLVDAKSELASSIESNPDDVVHVVRDQDAPPRQYVYSMMANMLADTLESGSMHIYRGVLSIKGKMALSMFEQCVDELERIGLEDANALGRLRADLKRNIKEVG